MLDIKFKSNLESLEIGSAVINLQANSGLFSAKINNQTISYNFTVIATANNVRNLKIPHIIESPDNFEDFEILILINNSIELTGILSIEDADDRMIKLSIKSEDLAIDFLKENINTFNYGADINTGPATADVIAHVLDANTKNYPATSHVFPMVSAPDFYGDNNIEFLGVVNHYDIIAATLVANTNTPVRNKNVLVPYFFLVFILKKIFESQNITLKGSFVDHVEVQKILLHNNLSLDEFDIERSFVRASRSTDLILTSSGTLFPIVFTNDSTFPNEDTSNIYNTTLGEFTIPHVGIMNIRLFNLIITNYSAFNGSPSSSIFEILVYIDGVLRGGWQDYFMQNQTKTYNDLLIGNSTYNLITTADVGKKMVLKALMYNPYSSPNPTAKIHAGLIIEMNLDKWTEFNIYSKTIKPSNHLPSMTAENFVNSFITGFKLMPYYDKIKRELHLSFFEDVFTNIKYDDISNSIHSAVVKKLTNNGFSLSYNFDGDTNKPDKTPDTSKFMYVGEYNCFSDLPTPPTVSLMCYVKSQNAFYVSLATTGITWVRYKENFDNFLVGDGSTPYILDFAPFIMDNISIKNDGTLTMREFLLPKINESGSSFFYKTGINEPMFKLLLWHGLIDGPTAAKPYPFASSYNIDQNGNRIGDFTFKLADELDSLYVQFLKNYFNFLLHTKKVEHVYTTDIKSPLTYNFLEKKLIINQRFLTGSLKLKITARGFESIVAENYKV